VSIEFSPLPLGPAYRRIAEAIAARITSRSLRAGEALPTETALASQLGVNRSTVREALRELESRRLVARRSGSKRLFVSRPEADEVSAQVSEALLLQDVTVLEIWETLMLLEPPAAEQAARRRNAEQLTKLRNIVSANSLATGPASIAVEGARQFFRAIIAANNNRALQLAHEPAIRLLASSLALMIHRVPQARQRIVTAQQRIVDAIAAGDAALAHEWMGKHIRDFRRGFVVAGIDLQQRLKRADAR
jgi:DNA-binding FadR family transcriptional regulator